MSSYDDVYYSVLSCEEIYYDWTEVTQGIDGSYRIFKSIVNIYDTLHQVDLACRHREIAYTVRKHSRYNYYSLDFWQILHFITRS